MKMVGILFRRFSRFCRWWQVGFDFVDFVGGGKLDLI